MSDLFSTYFNKQRKSFRYNFHQLLIAFDQFCNVFAGLIAGSVSYADETFSSRCHRWRRDGIRNWPANFVDRLLFFDYDKVTGKRHCELSYESEVHRTQEPPELRTK